MPPLGRNHAWRWQPWVDPSALDKSSLRTFILSSQATGLPYSQEGNMRVYTASVAVDSETQAQRRPAEREGPRLETGREAARSRRHATPLRALTRIPGAARRLAPGLASWTTLARRTRRPLLGPALVGAGHACSVAGISVSARDSQRRGQAAPCGATTPVKGHAEGVREVRRPFRVRVSMPGLEVPRLADLRWDESARRRHPGPIESEPNHPLAGDRASSGSQRKLTRSAFEKFEVAPPAAGSTSRYHHWKNSGVPLSAS